MDFAEMLEKGTAALSARSSVYKTRQDAYAGKHPLPFAPEGVSAEYLALRKMAALPLIRLSVRTTCQRLRAGGVRTGHGEEVDRALWRMWQRNNLGSRQRILYSDGLVHDGGIVSVEINAKDRSRPLIRPESPKSVYVEADPADPFSSLWALKTWAEGQTTVAVVWTDDEVARFETDRSSLVATTDWRRIGTQPNPLRAVPFITFVPEIDALGEGVSLVDALLPMQKAVDTMRFNLLLAAQFAAFRQRVVTGYDPVVRDNDGHPVVKRDADGEPILDADGLEQPIVRSPGKVGVDRALVFPGADTKIFDLQESNLSNYRVVLDHLVATFASVAQVPPQYLVGDFKNVSGDLMVATEATLRSLVMDLQTAFGESIKEVIRLAHRAAGGDESLLEDIEVDWADADPKSMAQIASAASQMIPSGAPLQMFLEQWPGATPQTVARWMELARQEAERVLAGDFASVDTGPKPDSVVMDPDDAKRRAEALGMLVRAGVKDAVAAEIVGLSGVEFTGAVPTSLRMPESAAAGLEDS